MDFNNLRAAPLRRYSGKTDMFISLATRLFFRRAVGGISKGASPAVAMMRPSSSPIKAI